MIITTGKEGISFKLPTWWGLKAWPREVLNWKDSRSFWRWFAARETSFSFSRFNLNTTHGVQQHIKLNIHYRHTPIPIIFPPKKENPPRDIKYKSKSRNKRPNFSILLLLCVNAPKITVKYKNFRLFNFNNPRDVYRNFSLATSGINFPIFWVVKDNL